MNNKETNYNISDEDAIKSLISMQHEIFDKDMHDKYDSIKATACSMAINAIIAVDKIKSVV